MKLIHSCINTVNFSILLNGSVTKTIKPSRGLRQGDPLSPFMFIMCAEVFTRLMNREERKGNIHGIKVAKNAPAVSHLLYTDYLLVMSRANKKEAEAFKRCFNTYCNWSSQEANLEKSSVLFSKRTTNKVAKEILQISGFKRMEENSIYLGNSLIIGRNRTKYFAYLKDRAQKRLERWSRQLLSKVGKVVLIKAVIQAIPMYIMSTFRVPGRICKDLDRAIRKFWWLSKAKGRGYMALRNWNDICRPKMQEGLGFRRFVDNNLALLSKLALNIASGKDALWIKIMCAKYLKDQYFFPV